MIFKFQENIYNFNGDKYNTSFLFISWMFFNGALISGHFWPFLSIKRKKFGYIKNPNLALLVSFQLKFGRDLSLLFSLKKKERKWKFRGDSIKYGNNFTIFSWKEAKKNSSFSHQSNSFGFFKDKAIIAPFLSLWYHLNVY